MLKTAIVALFVGVLYSTTGEIMFYIDILKWLPDVISFSITAGVTIGMYMAEKLK